MTRVRQFRLICSLALLLIGALAVPAEAARRRAVRHPAPPESPVLRFSTAGRYASAEVSPSLDPGRVAAMTIELQAFQTGDTLGDAALVSLTFHVSPHA